MSCFRSLLFFLILIFSAKSGICQKYDPGIMGTVDALFDGMRSGDSSKVRSTFAYGSTMMSVPESPTDSVATKKGSVDGFVKAVGKPHPEVWNEQIYDVKISVDGPIAIVWAPYKFFLGDKFSHCGVNVFTLIQIKNEWKIISIIDTRRKDVCR